MLTAFVRSSLFKRVFSSLQKTYAPHSLCFGCGPSNAKGLNVESYASPTEEEPYRAVASWNPEYHHEAFPNVLSGGIIGTILDCHSKWTAAHVLQQRDERGNTLSPPPLTASAEYKVSLLHPTPSRSGPVKLVSRVLEKPTFATCVGTYVAVRPGHPAYALGTTPHVTSMEEPLYVSSSKFDGSRIQAAVVFCSYGRWGTHVEDFVQSSLGLLRYERLALPGGAGSVMDQSILRDQLGGLIDNYALEKVVMVAHEGCSYYKEQGLNDPMALRKKQYEDVCALEASIKDTSGLCVEKYFVSRRENQVEFHPFLRP